MFEIGCYKMESEVVKLGRTMNLFQLSVRQQICIYLNFLSLNKQSYSVINLNYVPHLQSLWASRVNFS